MAVLKEAGYTFVPAGTTLRFTAGKSAGKPRIDEIHCVERARRKRDSLTLCGASASRPTRAAASLSYTKGVADHVGWTALTFRSGGPSGASFALTIMPKRSMS